MREEIDVFDMQIETIIQFGKNGLLLVSGEKANPMTIGWGTIGIIWGKPVFTVLVRPSRYTFGLIEECNEFTVNVPSDELKKQVAICGTKSGRDLDKIKKCNFTITKGKNVSVHYINECYIHYECKVIHKNNVINAELNKNIVKKYYSTGDYHTIYYGEILGVYKEM